MVQQSFRAHGGPGLLMPSERAHYTQNMKQPSMTVFPYAAFPLRLVSDEVLL